VHGGNEAPTDDQAKVLFEAGFALLEGLLRDVARLADALESIAQSSR
jgi:hypothetical protein